MTQGDLTPGCPRCTERGACSSEGGASEWPAAALHEARAALMKAPARARRSSARGMRSSEGGTGEWRSAHVHRTHRPRQGHTGGTKRYRGGGGGISGGDNFGGEIFVGAKFVRGRLRHTFSFGAAIRRGKLPHPQPLGHQLCETLKGPNFEQYHLISKGQGAGSAPSSAKKNSWGTCRYQTEKRTFPHEIAPLRNPPPPYSASVVQHLSGVSRPQGITSPMHPSAGGLLPSMLQPRCLECTAVPMRHGGAAPGPAPPLPPPGEHEQARMGKHYPVAQGLEHLQFRCRESLRGTCFLAPGRSEKDKQYK